MRLAVYTDYSYRRAGDAVFGERAFVLFLARLAESLERMVILGRLDPAGGSSHYRLPAEIEFVALPHYESQVRPLQLSRSLARSLIHFWRVLGSVDCVWLLGPHPVALAFAALARLRRRKVVLGVRQDLPAYARSRRPARRWTHVAADLLDAAYRALARRFPTVVVGPQLARRYQAAARLLPISVSLVERSEIVSAQDARARRYDGELRALAVGRLETEKNPLLLADVLARLDDDRRWRLVVCGEGELEPRLEDRLATLGERARAELRGYVAIDGGLRELYRASHAFLHVSWTEGVPQVLFEAFAAGLPVVATSVGGVAEAVGDAALLVPPGDADAAARALARVAGDVELRARLIDAGLALVRERTIESETARLLEFLSAAADGRAHDGDH
jgi:glycosyltransferase involved in cell wall biosynthesis